MALAGAGRIGEPLLLAIRRFIQFVLVAAQVFTFSAESMIRRPVVRNDEVKAFGPVGTSTAEMPDMAAGMCSVFHGATFLPLAAAPMNKA